MARFFILWCVVLALPKPLTLCQGVGSSFSESFDTVSAPDLPDGWWAVGFAVSASAPRSAPNAAAATGNMGARELRTPVLDFGGAQPCELIFYERRSSTAANYRLEVSASVDSFQSVVLRETFDAIPVLTTYVKRSVDLSSLVSRNLAGLQIRWSILPDGTNATGVLRIDDVQVSARVALDLAVERVSGTPSPITAGEALVVHAHLLNRGMVPASGYEVDFVLESEGRFAACAGPLLGPGDSVVVSAAHAPLRYGPQTFSVAVMLSGDGNGGNDTAWVTLQVGAPRGSILINEIMYAPEGDEPEWLELVNVTADTVSLEGWTVSDHGLSRKNIDAASTAILAPSQYGIIARELSFSTVHPLVAGPVFTAEFSALNNATADGPILYSDQGLTIDSVRYDPSWGGQGGRSLERKDVEQISTDPSAWATSTDSLGCTPGRVNSTARRGYDLAVVSVVPAGWAGEEVALLRITVVNVGKWAVPEYDVLAFDDLNDDGWGDEHERLVLLHSQGPLASGDSIVRECTVGPLSPGEHRLIAAVRSAADQRTGNDQAHVVLVVRSPAGAIIVNEVMYEPMEGLCEWVELYNPTASAVDVRGWMVSDAATASGSVHRILISSTSRIVEPADFIVIAADSTITSWPFYLAAGSRSVHVVVAGRGSELGLSNDGDAVRVSDAGGFTVDSLSYDPRMHHPHVQDVRGRSLERIRPDAPTNDRSNWSTASGLSGGSPGRENTIAVAVVPSTAILSIHPNPFSPDGDGREDVCVIVLEVPFTTASVRARIFDARGRIIRTLAAAEHVGARSQIIWNGLDDRRDRVPIGPYVVLVEATDPRSGRIIVHKAVAVVGTRL